MRNPADRQTFGHHTPSRKKIHSFTPRLHTPVFKKVIDVRHLSLFPILWKIAGKGSKISIEYMLLFRTASYDRAITFIFKCIRLLFIIARHKIVNHILHLKWGVPKVNWVQQPRRRLTTFGQLNHFEFFARKCWKMMRNELLYGNCLRLFLDQHFSSFSWSWRGKRDQKWWNDGRKTC